MCVKQGCSTRLRPRIASSAWYLTFSALALWSPAARHHGRLRRGQRLRRGHFLREGHEARELALVQAAPHGEGRALGVPHPVYRFRRRLFCIG